MQAIIKIKENSTGRIATFKDIVGEEGTFNPFYSWEEGNFSCDCNRHLLFHSHSDYEGYTPDFPCGDDFYSVEITSEEGIILYSEF